MLSKAGARCNGRPEEGNGTEFGGGQQWWRALPEGSECAPNGQDGTRLRQLEVPL